MVQVGPGMCMQTRGNCEACNGSGDILSEEDKCPKCKGEKCEQTAKEFLVKLDPGCAHGQEYDFPNEGNEIVRGGETAG